MYAFIYQRLHARVAKLSNTGKGILFVGLHRIDIHSSTPSTLNEKQPSDSLDRPGHREAPSLRIFLVRVIIIPPPAPRVVFNECGLSHYAPLLEDFPIPESTSIFRRKTIVSALELPHLTFAANTCRCVHTKNHRTREGAEE